MIRFSNPYGNTPDGFIFVCRKCHYEVYAPKQHYYKYGNICKKCIKDGRLSMIKFNVNMDLSTEPINIHCQCMVCDKRIVLPEKVWQKRGAICNRCYHQIHDWEG